MKFLLYIIKFINTTVVLIGITASLHAQSSDCLNKSCSKTSKNGEIEVEFGYQLKIADDVNGKISFKNGQYIIDTKEKSKVKILNVEVTNDTSGLMVFFDKKWLPPNSLFTYGTKDFTKGKDNGDLRLKLNNIQSPSDFILRFGIGESRSSIPTYTDSITFSFRIEGEEKAIKTENPVAPPIKENTTKTKEIITKKEEELEAPKRNDIDTTNSIAVTTPKPRQKPKEAIKKTPEPPKPSPTLKAPPVEESPTKSEKKPKETRAQRKRRKEKEAWENALKENTITTYRKFEEDYPKSKNIKESKARRRHIRSESPKKTENGYSIILKNVFDPVVVEPVPNATIEFNKIDKRPYHRELIVSNIENQKNIEIHIKDKEKPKSFKPFPIRLGKHLEVPANAVVISQDTQRIEKIIFKNGKPPYKITFFSEKKTPKPIPIDRTDYKVESGDTIFEWTPIDNFFKDNELYDTITFTLSDSELNMPYSHDNWILPRPEEKTDTTLYWVLVAGLGLLLLCALYVAYKVVGKKRNREKYNKKRKEKSESFKKENEHKKETILNNKIDVEEGGNEYVFENQQALLPNTNPNIKIKSIRKASRAIEYEDERKLEKILATEVSFSLPMSSFWQDSSISEIYFKKNCVETLDDFIWQQKLSPLIEANTEIPEIGGILMGKPYKLKGKNTYKVLIEQFVPINPEYHDVYRFEFSKESIAKDLGNIQDNYPELMLVGWFHTHPGHGLFLSKPDLRIHDSFFKEPYQLAMEIDTLTPQFEAAFFTRMNNGKVNNRKDLKKQAKWFSWLEATNTNG